MNEDHHLVKRVLYGDQQAFGMLIKQHQRLVWHMVSRVLDDDKDKEDVCQEVFLKVFKHLKKFNHQSKLSTWIATIAYHTAISYAKKYQRQQTTWQENSKYVANVSDTSTVDALDKRDRNQFIQQQIQQLPAPYKMMLTMYHLEEMNYAEIVEATGKPEGTVKSYLFRARKMLKEKLQTVFSKEEFL